MNNLQIGKVSQMKRAGLSVLELEIRKIVNAARVWQNH